MRNLLKAGLVWAGLLLSSAAYGQFFSHGHGIPLGAMPMQYNGSFAGEAGAPRVSMNTRYFRTKFDPFYQESFNQVIAYDQFVPAIRSGIGVTAGFENYKRSGYLPLESNNHFLIVDVAPKFSIKGKYTLSPSISLQYSKRETEMDIQQVYKDEGLSSKIGLMFNTPKYYIGFSINGIQRYRVGYMQYGSNEMPYQSGATLQAGYTFQKNPDSKFSFTPQLVFRITNDWGLNEYSGRVPGGLIEGYNLNFRYSKFIWGLNNAGIHLGMQTDRLRLMLTTNLAVIGGQRYNGNLSFRYVFKE